MRDHIHILPHRRPVAQLPGRVRRNGSHLTPHVRLHSRPLAAAHRKQLVPLRQGRQAAALQRGCGCGSGLTAEGAHGALPGGSVQIRGARVHSVPHCQGSRGEANEGPLAVENAPPPASPPTHPPGQAEPPRVPRCQEGPLPASGGTHAARRPTAAASHTCGEGGGAPGVMREGWRGPWGTQGTAKQAACKQAGSAARKDASRAGGHAIVPPRQRWPSHHDSLRSMCSSFCATLSTPTAASGWRSWLLMEMRASTVVAVAGGVGGRGRGGRAQRHTVLSLATPNLPCISWCSTSVTT